MNLLIKKDSTKEASNLILISRIRTYGPCSQSRLRSSMSPLDGRCMIPPHELVLLNGSIFYYNLSKVKWFSKEICPSWSPVVSPAVACGRSGAGPLRSLVEGDSVLWWFLGRSVGCRFALRSACPLSPTAPPVVACGRLRGTPNEVSCRRRFRVVVVFGSQRWMPLRATIGGAIGDNAPLSKAILC